MSKACLGCRSNDMSPEARQISQWSSILTLRFFMTRITVARIIGSSVLVKCSRLRPRQYLGERKRAPERLITWKSL